jgi:cytochrome c3-like protein
MASRRNLKWWAAWLVASATLVALLALGLNTTDAEASYWRLKVRGWFVPGQTTSGHHQIELACEACHKSPFAGREAIQESCMRCHGAELKEARDTHPRSKFTDPRNAERAALLDAAQCITCHVEHRPGMTRAMGVTLPDDYCVICHRDIGRERPTHAGASFRDCTTSGCHNFHDNRALYEDFLVKHAQQPAMLEKRTVAARDFRTVIEELSDYPAKRFPLKALGAGDADAVAHLRSSARIAADWLETSHAKVGVNCSGCHQPKAGGAWIEKPTHTACEGCHGAEVRGFLGGKHGMRQAVKLPAMDPSEARAPMRGEAAGHVLGCVSCHAAHRFDTRRAESEACLGCHADRHSVAYEGSPHQRLLAAERAGQLPAGSGVSCATCHLPRIEHRTGDDVKRVLVQHNQNDALRPAEKMIRPVCLQCHGLRFSIDALADARLVAANFRGRPVAKVPSIDWALAAERRAAESRKSKSPPTSTGERQ